MLHQKESPAGESIGSMGAGSLRELVIQAGLEILERDGLGLRPDSVSYAKVFAYLEEKYSIKVTRGSVHERIWDTHDDFRREVLAEALDYYPHFVRLREVQRSETAFRHWVGYDPDLQRRTSEFCRRAGTDLWEESIHSPVFSAMQSLKAIASRFNDPIASEVLHESLAARARSRIEARRPLVGLIFELLGRRGNRQLGLSQQEMHGLLYMMQVILSAGGHLNHRSGCGDLGMTVKIKSGPSGEFEAHTVAAIAFRACLELLSEPRADGHAFVKSLEGKELGLPTLDDEPGYVDVRTNGSVGQRRSRDELKRLVLAAGLELLLEDGLVLKPESLRYSNVLAHIRDQHGITVSRASVHGRLWDSHEEFCHEVLARSVLTVESHVAPTAYLASIVDEVEAGQQSSAFPVIDLTPRQKMLDEMRLAANGWEESLAASSDYRRRLLIKASLQERSDGPSMQALQQAIQETEHSSRKLIERFVRDRFLSLGFAVKPDLGLDEDEALDLFARMCQAFVAGAVFNRLCGIETGKKPFRVRRCDGTGRFDDWSATGLAGRAFFEFLFCLGPDGLTGLRGRDER